MTEDHHDARDRRLRCADCDQSFVWTAGEQDFFAAKNLSQPKRCASCRRMRRQHAIDAARVMDPRRGD